MDFSQSIKLSSGLYLKRHFFQYFTFSKEQLLLRTELCDAIERPSHTYV